MLWVVYSSVASTYIDDEWRDRIKQDLEETGIATIVDGQNPIMKVPVIVSGNQGIVYIDEIPRNNDVNDTAANADGGNDGADVGNQALHMRLLDNNRISGDALQNWMLQLQSGFMSLRRENLELRNEISAMTLSMERGFQIVNGNVRRVALQPARRRDTTAMVRTATMTDATAAAALAAIGEGAAEDTVVAGERAMLAPALAMTNPATLMPNPKSLFDLWTEYLFGVGGRKPARLFSETERGRVKYKYTRRKVIWDVVRDLVSLGHSSQRAIDMIYNVYGPQTSVTDIINRMRKDKKNGTLNPNLRI